MSTGKETRTLRQALEQAEQKGFKRGYETAVAGALAKGLAVQEPPERPFRISNFGWNRHGAVHIFPVEMGDHAKNAEFDRMLHSLLTTIAEQMHIPDPSPYDVGAFLGMNGGPINPMETGLMILREFAAACDGGQYGERLMGEWGVCVLMTYFRDVLGGFYAGARSRGGEDLKDEAMDAMRVLRKAKRF